jgi:GT2 family glycosyltransferase
MTDEPALARGGPEPGSPGARTRLLDRVAPEGTTRRAHLRASRILAQRVEALVGASARTADEALLEYRRMTDHGSRRASYARWSREHAATKEDLKTQRQLSSKVTRPTRFLVVVENQAGGDLGSTLSSLRRQSWDHWEAAVIGYGTVPDGGDPRIIREPIGGRAVHEVLNAVIERSEADFLLFARAGDELAPNCLFSLYEAVWADPLVDLITFDDDVIGAYGVRKDPRFRPAWSPEMLLGSDYIDRAFGLRRSRFLGAGGMQRDGDRAGFWDLLLRCRPDASRVTSVSKVLLHRGRPRDERVSESGVEVVAAHLQSEGIPATAEAAGRCVRIVWALPAWPSVSIIIPTRHNRLMISRLLTTLRLTDYPGPIDVTVVDNGDETPENRSWYNQFAASLNLRVRWSDEPFNYSRVNNVAAQSTSGDVLVFLNDDMEILDETWLREVVGWAVQPRIGMAGLMLLDGTGKVQHAGAVVGLGGFADHLFQGMDPDSQTMFGPVASYRDVMAVTGACLAIRRERFDAWGGFDENFELCGSDVALGLSAAIDGYRTVCSPFGGLRHFESATRGTRVPTCDFFASYWRYNPWLFGGDPYFSPNLSLGSRAPALVSRSDPTPADRLEAPLGRRFTVFRQRGSAEEAAALAELCRARPADASAVRSLHAANDHPISVEAVNWFIPELDSPFYGGINTALRIAAHLATNHGVRNNFVLWGGGPIDFVSSGIAAAFPSLRGAPLTLIRDFSPAELEKVPEADVGIATLWVTAYGLALSGNMRRKFYLIQDFEPMFYPAGTQYALAEETYRLGLYGLCNTENLARIYRSDYGGKAVSFTPAVDGSVFHAERRPVRQSGDPVTVFVYARPGHWRNCWEMAQPALTELKERLGDRVRILTAGSWAVPDGQAGGMRHLGLLDYRATGQLYRQCDVGLALTVSKHPSYLPLELMACGVPVVAFDNPWGHWILRDGENCLLADRTVDDLADRLERLCVDDDLRHRLQRQGLSDISERHGSWDKALHGVHPALCDPERATGQAEFVANDGDIEPPATRPVRAR